MGFWVPAFAGMTGTGVLEFFLFSHAGRMLHIPRRNGHPRLKTCKPTGSQQYLVSTFRVGSATPDRLGESPIFCKNKSYQTSAPKIIMALLVGAAVGKRPDNPIRLENGSTECAAIWYYRPDCRCIHLVHCLQAHHFNIARLNLCLPLPVLYPFSSFQRTLESTNSGAGMLMVLGVCWGYGIGLGLRSRKFLLCKNAPRGRRY